MRRMLKDAQLALYAVDSFDDHPCLYMSTSELGGHSRRDHIDLWRAACIYVHHGDSCSSDQDQHVGPQRAGRQAALQAAFAGTACAVCCQGPAEDLPAEGVKETVSGSPGTTTCIKFTLFLRN